MEVRYLALALVFLSGCTTALKTPEIAVQPAEITPENKVYIEPQPVVEKAPTKKTKLKAKNASQNTPQNHNYVGMQGFLTRPPMFADSNQEKSFQRCLPIEITGLYQSGKTISIHAKQNGQTFSIVGINRKAFTLTEQNKVLLLEQYFAKELILSSVGRKIASEQERVCAGQTWKSMQREQFQFVIGDPEYRQQTQFAGSEYDVWTYGSVRQSNLRYYYFLSDRLVSWTK
ncbi:hypothetical protein [Bdellovibrio sp. HCB337]|uniref:hypothetical protein n=1 Tax=Bdellovibrio sp. HCB337 TaxID=3394358 RepID=UPI0039A53671